MPVRDRRGFAATIAVMLVFAGMGAFAVSDMAAAYRYADAVGRREARIQAGLYADACLDAGRIMAGKYALISGSTALPDFACTLDASQGGYGHVYLRATAMVGRVSVTSSATVFIGN